MITMHGPSMSLTPEAYLSCPILVDPDLKVAKLYGMFHPQPDLRITVRSVFPIDPANQVRLILTPPPSAGRNVDTGKPCLRLVKVAA